MSAFFVLGALLIIWATVLRFWNAKENEHMDKTYGTPPDEASEKEHKSTIAWMYGLGTLSIVAGLIGLALPS
ncbi:hypothetical protein WNY37_07890 [Henriciella sp. AS95]|uniref:hypothetical protein n=1 Tax=Henriciella sp. AS95 TaxID=3135782 RepID=UPI00316E0B73